MLHVHCKVGFGETILPWGQKDLEILGFRVLGMGKKYKNWSHNPRFHITKLVATWAFSVQVSDGIEIG